MTKEGVDLAKSRMVKQDRRAFKGIGLVTFKRVLLNPWALVFIVNYIFFCIDTTPLSYFALRIRSSKQYSMAQINIIPTGAYVIGFVSTIYGPCVSNNNDGKGTQIAYISYASVDQGLPTSKAAPTDAGRLNKPAEKTTPPVAKSVDIANFNPRKLPISSPFQITSAAEGRLFGWSIGNTTQVVGFQSPILQRLVNGNTTITPGDNMSVLTRRTLGHSCTSTIRTMKLILFTSTEMISVS